MGLFAGMAKGFGSGLQSVAQTTREERAARDKERVNKESKAADQAIWEARQDRLQELGIEKMEKQQEFNDKSTRAAEGLEQKRYDRRTEEEETRYQRRTSESDKKEQSRFDRNQQEADRQGRNKKSLIQDGDGYYHQIGQGGKSNRVMTQVNSPYTDGDINDSEFGDPEAKGLFSTSQEPLKGSTKTGNYKDRFMKVESAEGGEEIVDLSTYGQKDTVEEAVWLTNPKTGERRQVPTSVAELLQGKSEDGPAAKPKPLSLTERAQQVNQKSQERIDKKESQHAVKQKQESAIQALDKLSGQINRALSGDKAKAKEIMSQYNEIYESLPKSRQSQVASIYAQLEKIVNDRQL